MKKSKHYKVMLSKEGRDLIKNGKTFPGVAPENSNNLEIYYKPKKKIKTK